MNRGWWLGLWLLALSAQAADAYRLDPEHTRVSFDVRRFGIPWIGAHFRELAGAFVVDRSGPDSRIDVTVRTNSITGLEPMWDTLLRSQDWLDTQRFPEMIYRSTHIAFGEDGGAVAEGELTLHGVTRPVTLSVRQLDCPDGPADPGQACAFAAYANIRRSDFGLPHGFWLAGDGVEISVRGSAFQ